MFHRNSGIKKNFTDESGGRREYHDSPSKTFGPTVLEIFVGELLGASLISRTEK